jgi:excisionase family DNA binding protein
MATSAEMLLRVEDAAHRIQVSRAQMYRLIASGEVGSVKIGASRRVPIRCLNEFVDRLIADQS